MTVLGRTFFVAALSVVSCGCLGEYTVTGSSLPSGTDSGSGFPLPGDSPDASANPDPADAGNPGSPDAGSGSPDAGTLPGYCASNPWAGLEACNWPGPSNTGPDLTACPGGALTPMGNPSTLPVITVSADNTVISCAKVYGELYITGKNVTVKNSFVTYNSGKLGEAANGTAPIFVEDGASAIVDHVEVDGQNGVHACIWHQGTSLQATFVNCHGVDDGIFSWADTSFSSTTGDNFTITDSYFHDFTTATSNGHEDGYQTEGSSNGLIRHNTFRMTTAADSAVAIWDSLKSSNNITIDHNLMAGGGATVYAEDYDPSESSPVGGFSVTNITLTNNVFSTVYSACVGEWFVWYSRPTYAYGGGPTDGWHRSGNFVLETGENVDNGNPHVGGVLCN